MILATRLDKTKLLVNIDSVKFVEATPDTLVTFLNGDSLIILESLEEIERRVIDFRVRTLKQLNSGG